MESNPLIRFLAVLSAMVAISLSGCKTTRPAQENVPPSAVTARTSEIKPVYILPKMEQAFVKPGRNKDGTWHNGYTTYVEVEPARLGTQEEAEMMGLPYVVVDNLGSSIPTPLPPGSPAQELNATTIAQILKNESRGAPSGGRPSANSLHNQSPRAEPTPPPRVLPELDVDPGPVIPDVGATPTPAPARPLPQLPTIPPPPPSTPEGQASVPKVTYTRSKGELRIGPGGSDGQQFAIPTPEGPATVTYTGGKIEVSFGGKVFTVDVPTSEAATIKLKE